MCDGAGQLYWQNITVYLRFAEERSHKARYAGSGIEPVEKRLLGMLPAARSGQSVFFRYLAEEFLHAGLDEPILVKEEEYRMTCVSMGNPHAVVFMKGVKELDIEAVGPFFENHERFPRRTNTEFVEVLDRSHVLMRVWERGTGETLACGTGCCATAVACILNGLTEDKVDVEVLGGHIQIEWNREENLVYMTGPAAVSFDGSICLQ